MNPHRQTWLVPGFCALVLGLAFQHQGMAAGVPYEPPRDYAEAWAKILALVMAAAAIGLILFTLAARRGRLSEIQARAMLFVGICVLPLPVMMMSTAVGLEQAKDIDFCRSCHAMRPFVEDMRSGQSPRLAAVHFKQRYIQQDHCYVCHTDYGLFGTVEAKVGGMAHIWREVTGSYRLPIVMKRGYRFTICLNCHGQSQKFLEQREHAGIVDMTVRGQSTCTECHDLSHPVRQTRS
jgi:nitrate/TMAO reductase-like tetraheme cytochrome c subunit